MSRRSGFGARGWMMRLGLATALLAPAGARARTLYVDAASADPRPPYRTPATAAQTIQDAVDAAVDGDVVRVAPGRYDRDGRERDGQLNRVLVDKAITVRAPGGALATTIVGARDPNAAPEDRGCGPLAVRGVYLAHPQAKLVGFRVTGGATLARDPRDDEELGLNGGGVFAATTGVVIAQCTLDANSAGGSGGGLQGGSARKCVLADNWAHRGGGAARTGLTDCRLVGNAAQSGGGAYECVLRRCEIRDNLADCECDSPESYGGGLYASQAYDSSLHHNLALTAGGGAHVSDLWNCTLTDNVAGFGGGAEECTLRNCILTGNRTDLEGGGTDGGTTYDCIFRGNRSAVAAACSGGRHFNALMAGNVAAAQGGAAYYSRLYNCTIVSNRSNGSAGGTYHSLHVNTIVHGNRADGAPETDNWESDPRSYWPGETSFYYCCTTPLPPGPGNIDAPPGFQTDEVQAWMDWAGHRLSADSPCVDSGSAALLTNDLPRDLGGLARIAGAQIDMGAYEQQNPAPPDAAIYVDAAQATSPLQDGTRQHPFGTIQDGIDAAAPNGDVLLRNGIYTGPGNKEVSFRGKSIAVHSENGPGGVVVDCENQGRGFVFDQGETEGAQLRGITIRNGMATNGGAIYSSNASPRIEDCQFDHNVAYGYGGAVFAEGGRGPRLARCRVQYNAARIVWQANYWGGQGAGLYSRTEAPARIEDSEISRNSGESTAFHVPAAGAIEGPWEASRCSVAYHTNHFMAGFRDVALVEDCEVRENAFGICGADVVRDSRIENNSSGGLYVTRPSLTTRCRIARNGDSGILCQGAGASPAIVAASTIVSNASAAECYGNLHLRLEDCRIAGNGGGSGAGMGFIEHVRCTIEGNGRVGSTSLGALDYNGCLIRGNRGPAFVALKGGIRLNNCTIVDTGPNPTNGPTLFHGGYNGWIQIRNCIAWNNGTNLYTHEFHEPSVFSGDYSLIQYSSTRYTLGEGSLDEDPQFVSATNFHLRPTSPALGAGHPPYAPAGGDIEGNAWGFPPPMGAYALSGPVPDGASGPEGQPDFAIRSIRPPVDVRAAGGESGPRARIGWDALPNRTYSLLKSTNLLQGFQPAESIDTVEGGPLLWDIHETAPSGPAVFYRLRLDRE